MPDKADIYFGNLAVREGLASREEVDECLAEKDRLAAGGKNVRIGTVMVRRGLIDERQAQSILSRQNKKLLRCPACGKTYTVLGLPEGKTLRCKECRTPLAAEGASVADPDSTVEPLGVSQLVETTSGGRGTLDPLRSNGSPGSPARNSRSPGSTTPAISSSQAPTIELAPVPAGPGTLAVEAPLLTGSSRAGTILTFSGAVADGDPLVGKVLSSRYRIHSKIGQGGMGAVYKAIHLGLERTCAVKILPPHLAADATLIERFRREAIATAQIHQANIVTIHDVGNDLGYHYLAMEFLEGSSLESLVRSRARLPWPEALDLGRQAAGGLAAAHAKGIFHRDVKPANLMLTGEGIVKVMDFGLARLAEGGSNISRTGQILGTPHYMSPEQAKGDELDHRTDVYSLGATLYALIGGRTPFEATTATAILVKAANEEPRPLESLVPGLPRPIAALVARMMAKDPGLRYQSMEDVLADMDRIQRGETLPIVSTGGAVGPDLPRRWRLQPRHGLVAAALIAAAAVIVAALWVGSRPAEDPTGQHGPFEQLQRQLIADIPTRRKVVLCELYLAANPDSPEAPKVKRMQARLEELARHEATLGSLRRVVEKSPAMTPGKSRRPPATNREGFDAVEDLLKSGRIAEALHEAGRILAALRGTPGESAAQDLVGKVGRSQKAAIDRLKDRFAREVGSGDRERARNILDDLRKIGLALGAVKALEKKLQGNAAARPTDLERRIEAALGQAARAIKSRHLRQALDALEFLDAHTQQIPARHQAGLRALRRFVHENRPSRRPEPAEVSPWREIPGPERIGILRMVSGFLKAHKFKEARRALQAQRLENRQWKTTFTGLIGVVDGMERLVDLLGPALRKLDVTGKPATFVLSDERWQKDRRWREFTISAVDARARTIDLEHPRVPRYRFPFRMLTARDVAAIFERSGMLDDPRVFSPLVALCLFLSDEKEARRVASLVSRSGRLEPIVRDLLSTSDREARRVDDPQRRQGEPPADAPPWLVLPLLPIWRRAHGGPGEASEAIRKAMQEDRPYRSSLTIGETGDLFSVGPRSGWTGRARGLHVKGLLLFRFGPFRNPRIEVTWRLRARMSPADRLEIGFVLSWFRAGAVRRRGRRRGRQPWHAALRIDLARGRVTWQRLNSTGGKPTLSPRPLGMLKRRLAPDWAGKSIVVSLKRPDIDVPLHIDVEQDRKTLLRARTPEEEADSPFYFGVYVAGAEAVVEGIEVSGFVERPRRGGRRRGPDDDD